MGRDPFDRTMQFHNFATQYQNEGKGKAKGKPTLTSAQASAFAKEASNIGKQIQETTEKLKRLASCMFYRFLLWVHSISLGISKSTSLFRESTVGGEISQKTSDINHVCFIKYITVNSGYLCDQRKNQTVITAAERGAQYRFPPP
jgi:hypothetical protein